MDENVPGWVRRDRPRSADFDTLTIPDKSPVCKWIGAIRRTFPESRAGKGRIQENRRPAGGCRTTLGRSRLVDDRLSSGRLKPARGASPASPRANPLSSRSSQESSAPTRGSALKVFGRCGTAALGRGAPRSRPVPTQEGTSDPSTGHWPLLRPPQKFERTHARGAKDFPLASRVERADNPCVARPVVFGRRREPSGGIR